MENKYVTMHETIRNYFKTGSCPVCGSTKVVSKEEICLDCQNRLNGEEVGLVENVSEIEKLKKLFTLCDWMEVN